MNIFRITFRFWELVYYPAMDGVGDWSLGLDQECIVKAEDARRAVAKMREQMRPFEVSSVELICQVEYE